MLFRSLNQMDMNTVMYPEMAPQPPEGGVNGSQDIITLNYAMLRSLTVTSQVESTLRIGFEMD